VVNLIHIPSQNDYRKRLGADFAAKTPPDIMLINYRRYAEFAAKGALEPLGPYLDHSTQIKQTDFYPAAIDPFIWKGVVSCIPQNLSSLVVYYNKDLFTQAGIATPQPGWTWDDFVRTAQALTRDTDGDGRTDQFGIGTEVSLLRLAPFIWQNNGALVDDAATPTRLTLNTPAAREAFQWFVDLQVKQHVAPDAAAEESESSERRFLNGRLGMLLNSRRGTPTYREIQSFDWDVALLPQGRTPAGVLHSDAYCMASATTNKPAAWAFIEYANSVEGQTIIAKSGRTVPSLRSVAESAAFLDPNAKPQTSRVFLDGIAAIRTVPIMEHWADIEDLTSEELSRAFYGQASVDEAIRTAEERSAPFFKP
jgi:multiple sugar transport system substrate-binding protein